MITQSGDEEFANTGEANARMLNQEFNKWNVKIELVYVSNKQELEAALQGADAYSALFHQYKWQLEEGSAVYYWKDIMRIAPGHYLDPVTQLKNRDLEELTKGLGSRFKYYTCGKDHIGKRVLPEHEKPTRIWYYQTRSLALPFSTEEWNVRLKERAGKK
jgi:hypothetical protein